LLFVFFFGGQTILRIVYYGEVFPNTYYLKMTGFPILLRLSRGLFVWWKFIWNLNLILFLVPVLAVIFTYNHSLGTLATVIVLQMLYSIYVGGDAWEEWGGSNRYIAFVMPQFFILFAYGINLIKKSFFKNETTLSEIQKNSFKYKTYDFIRRRNFIALLLFAFFQFNNSVSFNMRGFLFIDLPPHVENIKNMVERALLIKRITTSDARIAVTWAGAIPYFSERYTVDILGKTDKTIARLKMRRDRGLKKYTQFVPGHMKFDYEYSLGELKPDAVLQFWGDLKEPEPYILGTYTKLVVGDKFYYLRNGSKKVRWDDFSKEKK